MYSVGNRLTKPTHAMFLAHSGDYMEEPGLKSPSFEGYSFPTLKENAGKAIAAQPESFSIINIGWSHSSRSGAFVVLRTP